jgi:non-ribosomal peptide synthetase component E (peptide arylation enzyme)
LSSTHYKAPEDVLFLDQMPMNAVGKVDREKTEKMGDWFVEKPP